MTTLPSKRNPFGDERQFGYGVGSILALIGAYLIWRRSQSAVGATLLSVGVSLVALGVVYPRALVYLNRWWLRIADGLSFVSTRVVLGFVFFIVVTPTGVVRRLTGWDPLGRRRYRGTSYWVPYSERQRDPKHFEKMF